MINPRSTDSRFARKEPFEGLLGEVAADRRRGGGGGRGRVEHVEHVRGALEEEVVGERAVAGERLAAHAGGAELDVGGRNSGKNRCISATNADLTRSRQTSPAPMRRFRAASRQKPGQASTSATSRTRTSVRRVALPREGENGVRAGEDAAVDLPREMDAEERERRVGHGVDEPVDEAPRLGPEGVVVAPERDDPVVARRISGQGGDAVGLEAGAGDDVARRHRPGGRDQLPLAPRGVRTAVTSRPVRIVPPRARTSSA